jgi:hypothetical protein
LICISKLGPLPSYLAVSVFSRYQIFKNMLGYIFQYSAGVPDLVRMDSNGPETLSEEVSSIFI